MISKSIYVHILLCRFTDATGLDRHGRQGGSWRGQRTAAVCAGNAVAAAGSDATADLSDAAVALPLPCVVVTGNAAAVLPLPCVLVTGCTAVALPLPCGTVAALPLPCVIFTGREKVSLRCERSS